MSELKESLLEIPQDSKVCVICNTYQPKFTVLNPCGHDFCEECLKMYLNYKVENGEVLGLTCPYTDCETYLEDSYIRSQISTSTYMKYKTFRKLRLLEKNINLRWCNKPNCEGYSIGSVKNKKLTCNKCESNFCYFCGSDWHEGKKCSNQIDKEFEKWALSNSIKFCPNCKHRVLRDGGCTEMKCPLCSFSWCWICGVSTKEHNDYRCVMGKNLFELYWVTIFSMIFSIVLIPFAVFLFVIIKNEYYHIHHKERNACSRVLTYIGLFLGSPFILLIGGLCYCVVFISQIALECTGRKFYFVAVAVGLLFGSLIALFGFLVLGLMAVLLPIVGIFFLLIKVGFVLKRRCKYEKRWEYYPRTVV